MPRIDFSLPPFNETVIDTILDRERFPWRRGYARRHLAPKESARYDALLRPIAFRGKKLWLPFPETDYRAGGTNCVSATFEAFLEAAERHKAKGCDVLEKLDVKALIRFRSIWYRGRTSYRGAPQAIAELGLGKVVPFADAQPGDFVQFPSHAAIYVGYDGERHVFWSSNGLVKPEDMKPDTAFVEGKGIYTFRKTDAQVRRLYTGRVEG